MKTVKITMRVVVLDDSAVNDKLFPAINDQFIGGEGIVDWKYKVLDKNTPPLEDIELFNIVS